MSVHLQPNPTTSSSVLISPSLLKQEDQAKRRHAKANRENADRENTNRAVRGIKNSTKPLSHNARTRLALLEHLHTKHDAELAASTAHWELAKGQLGRHVDAFVRPSCLALCAKLVVRLPREIRDQIYEALLWLVWKTREPGWTMHKHGSHFYNRGGGGMMCSQTYRKPLVLRPASADDALPIYNISQRRYSSEEAPQHLWDTEAVGEHVRREMVRRFYKTARFHAVIACRSSSLGPDGMGWDSWETGMTPHDHVTKIVIGFAKPKTLDYVRQLPKRAKITALMNLRYLLQNPDEGYVASQKLLAEVQQAGRCLRDDGYRVDIYVEGDFLNVDEVLKVKQVEVWVAAAYKCAWP